MFYWDDIDGFNLLRLWDGSGSRVSYFDSFGESRLIWTAGRPEVCHEATIELA